MTSDREDVATLSKANAACVTTNSLLTTQLKLALKQITTLTTRVDKLEKTPPITTPSCKLPHKKYCYTCGIQRDHGSRDCKKVVSGHKTEATWKNRMGGVKRGSITSMTQK